MRHRILFRPDDPAAGAAGGGDPPSGDPAAPAKGDPPKDPPAPPPKIEFTPEQQAHIDALVTERVKRAEKAAEKKATQQADEAARRAQMDESERLKAEKQDAEKRASDAEAAANARVVKAEAKLAAVAAGIKPERVEAALRMLDISTISVSDDGEPDAAAIALALQNLKKEIPELFGDSTGGAQRSGGDFGGGGAQKRIYTEAEIKAMSSEDFGKVQDDVMAAMREGRVVASK